MDLSGDTSKQFWSFSYALSFPRESEIATQWSAETPLYLGIQKLFSSSGAAAVPQGEVMQTV